MSGESCGNCRFFLPSENDQGVCRKNPPKLFMVQQGAHPSPLEIQGRRVMSPAQMGFISQFPPIKATGWCGAFEVGEVEYVPESDSQAAGR